MLEPIDVDAVCSKARGLADDFFENGRDLLLEAKRVIARIDATVLSVQRIARDAERDDALTERQAEDLSKWFAALDADEPDIPRRKLRALLTQRDRNTPLRIEKILKRFPDLIADLFSECCRYFSSYWKGQDAWTRVYARALSENRDQAKQSSSFVAKTGMSVEDFAFRRQMTTLVLVDATPLGQLHSSSFVLDYLVNEFDAKMRWSLVAMTLVEWLRRRSELANHFREILNNQTLRTLLFPAPREDGSPGMERLNVQVEFVALILASWNLDRRGSQDVFEKVTRDLLKSTFGDPRDARLSEGWIGVREAAPNAFREFAAQLSKDDLIVFFEHAMKAKDRHNFWLRYVGVFVRTGCVLGRQKRADLEQRLRNKPALAASIERAYVYTGNHNISAFYLVFERHVVVEFSDEGNAAYLYDKSFFERELESKIREQKIDESRYLKNRQFGEPLLHVKDWQRKLGRQLSENGIHPA